MSNTFTITARRRGVLCFMAEEIDLRIKEQHFYVEQAKARLLPPFASIEEEADAAGQALLDDPPEFANPEDADMSVVYEAAFELSLERYGLLQEMRERTILGIVAGMYHHFDKCFRVRVARELRQAGWVIGPRTRDQIWRCDWNGLEDLFKAFGWDMTAVPQYQEMEALRLVVNVFKHGEGSAFEKLKQKFPRFVPRLLDEDPWLYIDYTYMAVSEENLNEFSDAIIHFWRAIPMRLSLGEEVKALTLPAFFGKALRQDEDADAEKT